mgnify:FL=1
MKAARLLRVLMNEPLNYRLLRVNGSHRILVSDNYPQLTYWPHEGKEITPKVVKDYLVHIVGLSAEEALELLK